MSKVSAVWSDNPVSRPCSPSFVQHTHSDNAPHTSSFQRKVGVQLSPLTVQTVYSIDRELISSHFI